MVFAAAAGGVAFSCRTVTDVDCRWVDVNAVFAGALQGESNVGRVDFKGVAAIEPAHVHVQRTFRELDLHGAIVEIQEGDAGLAPMRIELLPMCSSPRESRSAHRLSPAVRGRLGLA